MSRPYNNKLEGIVSRYQAGQEDTLAAMEFAKQIFYSSFGLGSSAYPKFAAFGEHLDMSYDTLGFQRVFPFQAGDELKEQRGSFNKWQRRYSIASAPKGENLSLVVGMMEYKTKTGHQKKGLATGNLNDMEIRCLTCGRRKKDTSKSAEIFT